MTDRDALALVLRRVETAALVASLLLAFSAAAVLLVALDRLGVTGAHFEVWALGVWLAWTAPAFYLRGRIVDWMTKGLSVQQRIH